jgi:hypothetical protein
LIICSVWKALTGQYRGQFECVVCSAAYNKNVILQGKRVAAHESSSTHKHALDVSERMADPLDGSEVTSELVRGPLTELLAEMSNPTSSSDVGSEWVNPTTGTVDWGSDMMNVDLTNDDTMYTRVGMELGEKLLDYLLDDGALEDPSDTEMGDYSDDEGEDNRSQGWLYYLF